jgi:hypothetical protein
MVRSYALPLAAAGATRLSRVYDSSYADLVLADRPLAYWRLGELSGSVAADASGNGHAGTITGGVTLGVPSPLPPALPPNTAMTFDGTSGYLPLTNSGPSMDLPGALTLEAWVNLSTSPNNDGWIISRAGITVQDYAMHITTTDGGVTNRLSFNYLSTPGGWIDTPGPVVPRGVWTHVAVTRDAQGTIISYYLNGVLAGTVPGGGLALSPAPVRQIGYDPGTPGYFKGSLDEIAIYPRALTAQQIAAHYAAGAGLSPYAQRILADQPLAYWRLNEPAGSATVVDSSGHGRTGTVAGAVTLGVPSLLGLQGAASFAGGDGDKISVADNTGIAGATQFSWEAWLRSTTLAAPASYRIALEFAAAGNYVGGQILGALKWYSSVFINSAQRELIGPLIDLNWHHVVVAYDGSALRMYLDGVVVATNPVTGVLDGIGKPILIGNYESGGFGWQGQIDDVALYSYGLSAQQVAAHYALGLTAPAPDIDDDLPFRQLLISPDPANAGPIVIGDSGVAAGAGGEGIVLAAPPLGSSGGSGSTVYRDRILLDTPLGYWRLGEIAGTVAADSSGNNHPGTYSGSYTLGAPSLVAGGDAALALAGAAQNGITIAGLAQPATMSIEAWVNLATTQITFARLYSCGAAFDIFFDPSRQFVLYLNFVEGASGNLSTGVNVPALTTTHIVATWDGTAIRIFLNGVVVYTNSTFAGRTLPGVGATTQLKAFGCIGGTTGADLIGTIDEVALYSVALSAATIAAHYQAGIVSYAQRILADNPTGYWRLGEASGLTAADSSGHGYAGTITGGVTLAQPGAIASDTAALFNGTTGYISVPHAAPLAPTADFSVEAWVRFSGSTPLDIINHYGAGNFKGFFFAASESLADGRLELWTGNGWFRGTRVINDGQWHHVAATITGTTARIYVDGVLDSTGVATLDLGPVTFALEIGRRHDTLTYASGLIDEVALYSYALTPAQVLAHYQARALPFSAGSYPYRVLQDGATNYWRLNEASGLVAVDSIGGKNGTISGGVTLAQPGALASGDKAMTFDGTTGKIVTAAPVSLPVPWTYEAWVYYPALATYNPLLNTAGAPPVAQDLITIYVGPQNQLTWRHYPPGAGTSEQVFLIDPLAAGWHHLVIVNTSLVPLLYIDGVAKVWTGTLTQALAPISLPIEFGVIVWQNIYFGGSIDDVAIYPYALSPAQIAAHLATALSAPAALADRLTLGPFDTGPIKLSHIYAAGSGALRILGVPY